MSIVIGFACVALMTLGCGVWLGRSLERQHARRGIAGWAKDRQRDSLNGGL